MIVAAASLSRPSHTMAAARFILATLLTASLLGATTASATAAPPAPPAQVSATELVAAPYVVMLTDSDEDAPVMTSRLERRLGFLSSATYTRALRGFAATLTPEQVSQLRQDASVKSVVPDAETSAAGSKSPTRVSPELTPPGVKRIGADGKGAADPAVAVLDTGLDLANVDLNAAHGVNCVKSGKPSQDDDGHGTHVGGTIAARADGGDVVGVAPNTRLYSVKVLSSSGKGRLSGLLCGIEWVRTNAQRLNIRVANVSITASGRDDGACGGRIGDPLHAAICESTAAGIVYVAAAGNAGVDFAGTVPAAYPEVLTATAMTDSDGLPGGVGGPACGDADDTAGDYSNFAGTDLAMAHTLAAPGSCVASLKVGGGVETMEGTSMAAPHVAGAAALCIGEGGPGPCASLRTAAVIERLREDAAERAYEGHGFIGDPLDPVGDRGMGYLVSAVDY